MRMPSGQLTSALTLSVVLLAAAVACSRVNQPTEATAQTVPAQQSTHAVASTRLGASASSPTAAARSRPAPPRCPMPIPDDPPPTASPAANCPKDPTGPLALPRVEIAFVDAPAAPTVSVEHANDHPARERGLMYRTELGPNDGMLFSWPNEAPRSFWMKNTCLPLDMFFVGADGTIVGILEQVPPMNLVSRRLPCLAQHVLEMNAGAARRLGIKPGHHVVVGR